MNRTRIIRWLRASLGGAVLLVVCQVTGTMWHEVVGHGGVGLVCGGRLENVTIWGMQLYPRPDWTGWDGRYGSCEVSGLSERDSDWMALGGSTSTLIVSMAAIGLLWVRRWGRSGKIILATLGIWWMDLLTYTLPSWGLRRSLFWGARYSEPYEAATSLGLSGTVFQALVVAISVLLAALLAMRLVHLRRSSVLHVRKGPDVGA